MYSIKVFNVTGQLIATIHEGFLPEGYYQFNWTINDTQGRGVSPGTYIVQYRSQEAFSAKMIIVK